MRVHIGRAVRAGFVASTIVAFMLWFVSPGLTGGPSDLAWALALALHLNWVYAVGLHFALGTFVLPLLYARVLNPRLPGDRAARGLMAGALLWLVSQAVVVPAFGGGFFSLAGGGPAVAAESLVGHLIYGLVLGLWLGDPDAAAHPYTHPPHPGRSTCDPIPSRLRPHSR